MYSDQHIHEESDKDEKSLETVSISGEEKSEVKKRVPKEIEFPTERPFIAHVGNLSYDTTPRALKEFFDGLKVVGVGLPRDKELDRIRGFGFVEFYTLDDLKKAPTYDGKDFLGRTIKVCALSKKKTSLFIRMTAFNRKNGESKRSYYFRLFWLLFEEESNPFKDLEDFYSYVKDVKLGHLEKLTLNFNEKPTSDELRFLLPLLWKKSLKFEKIDKLFEVEDMLFLCFTFLPLKSLGKVSQCNKYLKKFVEERELKLPYFDNAVTFLRRYGFDKECFQWIMRHPKVSQLDCNFYSTTFENINQHEYPDSLTMLLNYCPFDLKCVLQTKYLEWNQLCLDIFLNHLQIEKNEELMIHFLKDPEFIKRTSSSFSGCFIYDSPFFDKKRFGSLYFENLCKFSCINEFDFKRILGDADIKKTENFKEIISCLNKQKLFDYLQVLPSDVLQKIKEEKLFSLLYGRLKDTSLIIACVSKFGEFQLREFLQEMTDENLDYFGSNLIDIDGFQALKKEYKQTVWDTLLSRNIIKNGKWLRIFVNKLVLIIFKEVFDCNNWKQLLFDIAIPYSASFTEEILGKVNTSIIEDGQILDVALKKGGRGVLKAVLSFGHLNPKFDFTLKTKLKNYLIKYKDDRDNLSECSFECLKNRYRHVKI
ncbi:hypothetical protein ABK040_001210 [Willaertia magna]